MFSQQNVNLLGQLNPYPSKKYTSCWGYTATDGREYALLGVQHGTSFIDITNPAQPVEVGLIPGPEKPSYHWREMKTHSNYAYIVSEGNGIGQGMQIVDLSNLPSSVSLVKNYTIAFTTAHNITIADGFAYVVGTSGGGMHILDLSDPVNPVQKSYYSSSGYIHDVYVNDDTVYASSRDTYDLIDVSDKTNPKLISQSAVLPGIYAHSGWLTEDKRYFVAAEEFNVRDLTVWDLQDRNSWNLVVTSWEMPENTPIHNIFIKGNYAHISYYKEGYVVLDVSNPLNPSKAGHYDTYPGTTGNFAGAWGCYPFFPSGNIIVSDMSTGLYVFDFLLDTPLPVELSSFTASVMDGIVHLKWITASEINNLGFEVQRSSDNSEWITIGFVAGKGSTTDQQEYSFNDNNTYSWKSSYRLVQNDFDGTKHLSESVEVNIGNPSQFTIEQNFPNPFNPITKIRYNIPLDSFVSLKIYNTVGELVHTVVKEFQTQGGYEINFDGNNLPSGLYIAKLDAGGKVSTIKMNLIK